MRPEDEYIRDEQLLLHDLKTLEVKKLFLHFGIDVSKLDLHQIAKLAAEFIRVIQIQKTAEDAYSVVIKDELRNINEDVNGSQLLSILNRERLIGTTAEDVLSLLDTNDIGHEMTVSYIKRP